MKENGSDAFFFFELTYTSSLFTLRITQATRKEEKKKATREKKQKKDITILVKIIPTYRLR